MGEMKVPSVHQQHSHSSLLPARPLLWSMRLLCGIALAISGYLAWTALTTKEVYGCGGGEVFDCGHVLTSQYSKIFGVPVSVPAFALYGSLLAVLAYFRPQTPARLIRIGWGVLTVGALSAGIAAAWFISIQVFELKHLCAYCLGAHSCGLLLAAIVLAKRPLGGQMTFALSGVSAVGVGVLVSGQLMSEPPQTFTVERFDSPQPQFVSLNSGDQSDTTTEFDAPVEFGAPVEFDAPVEFAPPVSADNLFAPPVVDDENNADVVNDPTARVTVPESKKIEVRFIDGTVNEQAAEASPDEADVSLTVPAREPLNTVAATTSTAAYLFFSPSTTQVALRFFSVPGFDDDPDVKESSTPDPAADGKDGDAKPVEATPPAEPKERLVTVSGNRFSLNTRHWPLLGNPDAKYVFVEMFDYTCPHCRHTHHAIDGAFKKYGDDLGVIVLPVPLERACNDAAVGGGHAGACDLAKLAVAVWRVDAKKFKEFHDWMFEAQRSYTVARAKAEQLVGKQPLATEIALPHAANYIGKHVQLYKQVGSGVVPKLMFPKSTMSGEVGSTKTLCSAIERELAQ